MLKGLFGKVVGGSDEREIRKLEPLVEDINGQEPDMERLPDAGLRALTGEFRGRLASGDSPDDLLVRAFAAVREAAKRTVDMRPFDVQLIGGIVLHQGKAAEMRTGEGKTLVATLPVYLNALEGHGVHLVTVNDYLARRDTLWMGPIYHLMGLSIGLLQSGREQPAYVYDPSYQRDPYPGLRPAPRKQAYAADITYGTNNEFGFDYLRDNLALTLEGRVQRNLNYAIVDEVDNIFVDEARTPLIISGPSGESVEDYGRFATIARRLEPEIHYELEEKERAVYLTDEGLAIVEQETGIENIYDEANYRYVHYMQQALKAQVLFLEGRDYIRQRKRVILVDQHTGRLMPSRRLSEGLHQAIEAKEGVPVQPRDVTSATVTIQNYFRMYQKLAGMSGTAVTEGEEFFKIYGLDVLAIPTNRPVIREDHADVVYRSEEAKLRAVAREIVACHSKGQPVLVGTTSVEMSERLSRRLTAQRLQMACLAPRIAYALQDAKLDKEERAKLRETMNASLETMNSAAWTRLMRAMDLERNALAPGNLASIAEYLELPQDGASRQALEQALRNGIEHHVLNAKEHTGEAAIIARAGQPGAVTIATNMAGRGVDIKLGGELTADVMHRAHDILRSRELDPFSATASQMDSAVAQVTPQYSKRHDRVIDAGGLHVLGTERHEARRIDNQLRGRSGRQGEPGSSRFYLSLEDDLMRRFGRREMLGRLMEQIGDDFPIEHNLVSRTLERAQTSVEGYNFDIRKHLLEYDDVLNRQRESIYEERLRVLQSTDLRQEIWRMLERQVDEYLEKYGEERDQRRLLFAGLDDIVYLSLPAPTAPFQGPLSFGGQLTAFPPYSISFIADQVAGKPLETVEETLGDLAKGAADDYGRQISQTVDDVALAILEGYDERLERYQALLDEKIEDFLQLSEERGQPFDPRRLAQHMERTYPLKLATARGSQMMEPADLREGWREQIEDEYHRQTCASFLSRVQIRLPFDIARGLGRLRPALLSSDKLKRELERVVQLAKGEALDEKARLELSRLEIAAGPDTAQVDGILATIKRTSRLDFGRLDRLVGHSLGAGLDVLISDYEQAMDLEEPRARRDLQRLRDGIDEGRKGRRLDLLSTLDQLNDLVHLEITDMSSALGVAVAHEYDKWAQRQLTEIESASSQHPLPDTTWSSVCEYLLSTYYSQRQAFDREHQRRITWLPRLPFSMVAQVYVSDLETAELREAVLESLRWAAEQREVAWGQQELRRWSQRSLADLDGETFLALLRFVGERELGSQREGPVDDLSPEIYEHLRFVLRLRELEGQRLAPLPHGEALTAELLADREAHLVTLPLGKLETELQEHLMADLEDSGLFDDERKKASFSEQSIRDWDDRTREHVAGFLGQAFVGDHKESPPDGLAPWARDVVLAYLQKQQYFVDESKVQHFLIHQKLSDLPEQLCQDAMLQVAASRLDRMSRRKISNLDVRTRKVVAETLQRFGLFSDDEHRDRFLSGTESLQDLGPELEAGFAGFLARQKIGDKCLQNLDETARNHVVQSLKDSDLLADPSRLEGLPQQRLEDLDEQLESQLREALERQLLAELEASTMEELPARTRRAVHQALDEQDYFVDPEKAAWYERKTLAQLPSELLHGLEGHLGAIQLAEIVHSPFRELPAETQGSLKAFFDSEGLLGDRAERLRITQVGSLAELSDSDLETVSQYLGRQCLVQIRDRRPPALPDDERAAVWDYLREQGYFADAFKEELFSYQRLDEFDAETRDAVEDSIITRLRVLLSDQPIGDLPADLQEEIRDGLRRADYFVDKQRLNWAIESPISQLPLDLRGAVELAAGGLLLEGQETVPLAQLSEETRAAISAYLDSIGYFIDEKKRSQTMERRLVDLGPEYAESAAQDLAQSLEAEIGDQPVSDLSDDLRQELRQAVGVLGYFESPEERERVLSQPLSELRREETDAVAAELGRKQLVSWAGRTLSDIPREDKEAILAHLQEGNWFLDKSSLEVVRTQSLGEIEKSLRTRLLASVRQQQSEVIRNLRLSDLDRQERHTALQFLRERGLGADEGRMRALRNERVQDLEPEAYAALLQDVGSEVVAHWGQRRFQDMEDAQRDLLGSFLGRRIMSRIERRVLLHTISRLWVDYLTVIEDLRRGIGLEAYGQRDPLIEYKRKAFELFEELGHNIRRSVVRTLFRQPPEPLSIQRAADA